MRLSYLIHPDEIRHANGLIADIPVSKPCDDSRKIQHGDLFFCMNGTNHSGFSFIEEATRSGACAIVTELGTDIRIGSLDIPVIEVKGVRAAYARAWSRYYGNPQEALRLIAITGTNGKTSTAYFLSEILRMSGEPTGLIGTVAYSDGIHTTASDYTTPPPDELYALFSDMKKERTHVAVMEASSHALAQDRLSGISFDIGIFSNLSRDHLDYHKSFEDYRAAKEKLFRASRISLINRDDKEALAIGFAAAGDVYYYSSENADAEFFIRNLSTAETGTDYELVIGDKILTIHTPLIGSFNGYNTAAAIAAARLLGVEDSLLTKAASRLTAPPGRLEKLATNTDFSIYIDYAHTPDALEKALLALRPLTKNLTVLFGAGGNRDRGKRPEMGRIADSIADRVIVTSDNPRNENPEAIIADIRAGIEHADTVSIPDRREAIAYAILHAVPGEIILLAGKGHENYVCDNTGKHDFSERDIVDKILKNTDKG